jgi:ATP-dependent DNA helicase RecQ
MAADPTRIPMSASSYDLAGALSRFGLSAFRPAQEEVIASVLAGRNVLCVMPTGGGKSLCYQLPAILLPKPTLVVSPLIALMKDQEDQLHARGIPATAIHSNLPESEQQNRLERIARGEFPIVYVAPERFRSHRFLNLIGRIGLSLLAVDEAHCISEWGHDFRPDYIRLGAVRKQLGSPPTIALTATATDVVRRDIVEQLDLDHPEVFVRGFDRPNLTYAVTETPGKAQKAQRLAEIIDDTPGSTIIYCASRKSCEEVAELLRNEIKRPATVYHAGLLPDERRRSQDRFMQGKIDVVVATNAFGMGVDKPDIRAVIHYNLPGSLEALYQEAGRAGRDGLPARCELLFSYSDRYIQEFFIDGEYPPPRLVFAVMNFLRELGTPLIELTRQELKERMGLDASEMAIGSCLKILEQSGALERLRPRQNMAIIRIRDERPNLADRLPASATINRRVLQLLERIVGDQRGEDVYFNPDGLAHSLEIERTALTRALNSLVKKFDIEYIPPFRGSATRIVDRTTPPDKLDIDFASLAERKNAELQKLERVFDYCRLHACRRQALLSYFGEKSDPCGNCDNCLGPEAKKPRGFKKAAAAVITDEPPSEAATLAVIAALEAVAELKGRFGKGLIAQTLTGSQSKEVARFGLQKRTCFARLAGMRQADVTELLEALLIGRLVFQQGDPLRPTLAISTEGEAITERLETPWTVLRLSPQLIAKLGRCIDQENQSPPPARQSVSAIVEKRGSQTIVESVVQTRDERPSNGALFEEAPPATPVMQSAAPKATGARPFYHWTAELLARGFSVAEAAEVRRLDPQIILEHALAAARAGKRVPRAAFSGCQFPHECDETWQMLEKLLS